MAKENKKLNLSVWLRILAFARPYKREIIILIVQMIFLGLVDAVVPLFNRYVIDHVAIPGRLNRLLPVLLIALIIIGLQALNVKYMIYLAGKLESFIPHDIRKAAFAKLQTMSLSYYDQTPTGWLLARLTSDSSRLGEVLSWNVVDLFWAVSMMALMMVFMLLLNVTLALMVLVTIPFLVLISIFFQKKLLANYRQVRHYNAQVTAGFNEGITGAQTIKSLSLEETMHAEFKETSASMRNFAIRAARASAVYTPLILLLGSVATGLVIWRSGHLYNNDPLVTDYGTVVAFISYAVQFFDPVRQFARVFTELNYAQASAERVISIIDLEPDIFDSRSVTDTYGDMLNPKRENWPPFNGTITFQDVTFSYRDGQNILENFNLEIRAGEKISLVGETGSGKTTIANLACRFYEPTSGKILIDGVDYRERPLLWLHANLGYVLQEAHLFSGTVRENIAYGRRNITLEQVQRAAAIVNAHSFIMQMQDGYDSQVGERGSRLSTGQKQLIAFARAIVSDPGLFVLDEATSSVDTETEFLIRQAMEQALEGRTSLMIAHRLSTIRSADRILVIEQGKISEEGTHDSLMQKRGAYWRLYTNQFLKEKQMEGG